MARKNQQAERAVAAMQKYLGSVDRTPVRVQQRFYERTIAAVNRLADKLERDSYEVWEAIESEALRRGVTITLPGKDY